MPAIIYELQNELSLCVSLLDFSTAVTNIKIEK